MTEANDPVEKPRPCSWRYVLLVLTLLVGGLILAGIAQRSADLAATANEMKQLIARLDESDPNWRLHDLIEAREPVPEAQNSVLVVASVKALLPKRGWPPVTLTHEALGYSGPAHRLDDPGMKLLVRELTPCEAAIREARRLADMPSGLHPLEVPPNPIHLAFEDFQTTRSTTTLLRFDVLRLAQEDDLRQAVRSCRAGLNAARSLNDQPFALSQLVRIAGVAIACHSLERTLAQGEPDPEELLLVQQLLLLEASHPTLRMLIRGERALSDAVMERLADGTLPLTEIVESSPEKQSWWWHTGPTLRGVRREHPSLLRTMTRFVESTDLPEHEQLAAIKELEAEIDRAAKKTSVSAQLTPALAQIAKACFRKSAQVRTMMVAVALERHRQKSGKWADKLDDLVPVYLEQVPRDPYDGKPLRYARWAEGVVVYSIGENGIDDGGKVAPSDNPVPGLPADLGYRLWDVAQRRQPPRPRPPVEPELLPAPAPEGAVPPGGK